MIDCISRISILQFFYECMEFGKSATLHSAYIFSFMSRPFLLNLIGLIGSMQLKLSEFIDIPL
jgi:hypothetical protein